MEHLANCHGEWNLLFALLGSIPVIGAWIIGFWHEDE
tara:strand:+ start:4937 stop:5047 length:111 start_codon:yes stop_codon:yes gene_type:complete